MWESFEPGRAGRIDPIGISGGRTGRDKAVGRKQDNSIECLEIGCLFPPGATVVSYKMLILLESRVIMCGKGQAFVLSIGETENLSLKPGSVTHTIKEETAVIRNISIARTANNSS